MRRSLVIYDFASDPSEFHKSSFVVVNLTKGHDDMLGGMKSGESEDQVGAHERVNVLHVKLAYKHKGVRCYFYIIFSYSGYLTKDFF